MKNTNQRTKTTGVKMALFAGAFDERIALTIARESGDFEDQAFDADCSAAIDWDTPDMITEECES